jgi:glycosyltransferase involved in cell wall biosynthesis
MYVYALIKAIERKSLELVVVIPNYGSKENEEYFYENIRVIKYAEPSIVDRELQMGKRLPEGLNSFSEIIKNEMPDIMHFHELAGSNGITIHHVKAARDLGCKVVMTFHLAKYSCKTDTLMYRNKVPCDGIISVRKCTLCSYQLNGLSEPAASFFYSVAKMFFILNIDTSGLNSRLGTALAYPLIISNLRENLNLLSAYCDKMVVISKWYFDVLLKNGISENKLIFIKQGTFNHSEIARFENKCSLPIKLIFVGRISHFKGVKMLISVINKLNNKSVVLDIYGDAGEEGYMEDCKIMTSGKLNISWKGRLLQKDVITTMSRYDLLCLPSTFSEMSPLVIQEAFAARIPVLASEANGNSEQIRHTINGWLFKFNDESDLLFNLQKLIDNPSLISIAKNNIPKVTPFSDTAENYMDLYQSFN